MPTESMRSLFILCLAGFGCVLSAGEPRPGAAEDQAEPVKTIVEDFKLIRRTTDKEEAVDVIAAGDESIVIRCRARAVQGKVTSVAIKILGDKDKLIFLVTAKQQGHSDVYEARFPKLDDPGQFHFDVVVNAEPDAVKPKRPPDGEF